MIRYLWMLLLLPMVSCVMGPSVTERSVVKNGEVTATTYHAGTGGSILGRRKGVIVDMVTARGDQIRYTAEEEDSVSWLEKWIDWKGINKGLEIAAPSVLKGTKDPNIIPKDPNVIPKDPNVIPVDPNIIE